MFCLVWNFWSYAHPSPSAFASLPSPPWKYLDADSDARCQKLQEEFKALTSPVLEQFFWNSYLLDLLLQLISMTEAGLGLTWDETRHECRASGVTSWLSVWKPLITRDRGQQGLPDRKTWLRICDKDQPVMSLGSETSLYRFCSLSSDYKSQSPRIALSASYSLNIHIKIKPVTLDRIRHS